MPSPLERLAYAARQTARVAWYTGHYWAGRRLLKPMPKPEAPPGPMPGPGVLTTEMRALFERDWKNIEAGLYTAPRLDDEPSLIEAVGNSIRYFRDLPEVDRRRHAGVNDEPNGDPAHAHLPRYYRQNFHFQTDGWLSERSAALYDTQVEVLFTGSADAMRRQGLVPIAEHVAGRNTRAMRLLDIGCGTGRFLTSAHATWPGMRLVGLDLSAPYLAHARQRIGETSRVRLVEGAGETMPFADASFDIVTSVFLFHELPRTVRAAIATEMARVLKPGGRVVIVDSLQKQDRPEWEGLLDLFPHYFHEPYYADYAACDLVAPFAATGLQHADTRLAFLSKVMVFDKVSTCGAG
jgi:ubiquinone/menaquinone biosynthesis C-methylase UbiE